MWFRSATTITGGHITATLVAIGMTATLTMNAFAAATTTDIAGITNTAVGIDATAMGFGTQ